MVFLIDKLFGFDLHSDKDVLAITVVAVVIWLPQILWGLGCLFLVSKKFVSYPITSIILHVLSVLLSITPLLFVAFVTIVSTPKPKLFDEFWNLGWPSLLSAASIIIIISYRTIKWVSAQANKPEAENIRSH